MSIQSEITRLESAKSAIAAAIAGKGVTVPDGTMLDGMAALIESIEAGGGGLPGFKMISGTYTPTENITSYVPVFTSGAITPSSSVISGIIARCISLTFVIKTDNIQYPTTFFNGNVFGEIIGYNKNSSSSSSTIGRFSTHSKVKVTTGGHGYGIGVDLPADKTYPMVSGQTYAWMLLYTDDISL